MRQLVWFECHLVAGKSVVVGVSKEWTACFFSGQAAQKNYECDRCVFDDEETTFLKLPGRWL